MRCPWHGACFNIKTGDIEDFPGLDSLNSYDVKLKENNDIVIKANKKVKQYLQCNTCTLCYMTGIGSR